MRSCFGHRGAAGSERTAVVALLLSQLDLIGRAGMRVVPDIAQRDEWGDRGSIGEGTVDL